jgi:4-amino-4-deoxy-L-arabinose transferase-like glycosyltransferase
LVALSTDVLNADTKAAAWRVKFYVIWSALLIIKLLLAWRLPLFGDEAFYAWEADHLAWAYSDLPGMTAWLIRLGMEVGGYHAFAIRLPFIAMMAYAPWLVMSITDHCSSRASLRWQSGILSCCLPLLVPVGFMALPEAPLCLAFLLCLFAAVKCTEQIRFDACLCLLLGLCLGAFTHYRFAFIILAGMFAFVMVMKSTVLKSRWLIITCAFGLLAWLPLLLYNYQHGNAGLQFQLFERNPWQFSWRGLLHLPIQFVIVSPFLYVILIWSLWKMLHLRKSLSQAQQIVALCSGFILIGYALLAFFVDTIRVSFHWPLQAYLGLTCIIPLLFENHAGSYAKGLSRGLIGSALVFILLACAYLLMAATPAWAGRLAGTKWYPDNFLGWDEIAINTKRQLRPEDIVIVDNFMVAAQLQFYFQSRVPIKVLDHPLNHKHGRAQQLQDWQVDDRNIRQLAFDSDVVIVIEETNTKPWLRDTHRKTLCEQFHQLQWLSTVYGPGKGKYFSIFRAKSGAQPGEKCHTELALDPQ